MTIALDRLVKSYRSRRVVDEVSLSVSGGEVVGLLGPNGAGKTTTFYMVVGLVKPESGRIRLNEVDITGLPMHRRARLGIGYLPQEASVFRRLSVEDNLRLIWQVRGVPRTEQDRRLEELLEEYGLQRVRRSRGLELSGGERRRVEIARALATRPDFLLLDEPFSGVDPLAVADIQDLIRGLKARGLGVLITDHNVRETLAITDRAYIIREGRILVAGDAREIANSSEARKYYLGERFQTGFEEEPATA